MWRGSNTKYDMNIFFWTGMLSANYTSISPIPVLFLTLDRCLALRFPLKYNNALIRQLISMCCVTIILIDYIGSTVILLLELPLPIYLIKDCITFGCVPIKHKTYYQLFWKTAFGSIDLLCGIYFFYLLRTNLL
ncbi:serpentine type 7TM GPCR chemoreceptor srbc domain-containing protein [Ditylenchus destructor]|nr:serpentine type 7TM GPCR chemoreceptor srbc domain-containing protein [Ditylenchus destructor]